MKKFLIGVMITALMLSAAIAPTVADSYTDDEQNLPGPEGIRFTDLPENHWAHDNVKAMTVAGVIQGYPDGAFRPKGDVTAGEFIKMAVISVLEEDPGNAEDGQHWAKNYYNAGLKAGWYNKTDISENGLSLPIKRQLMALIAARIINPGEKAVPGYGTLLDSISDVAATDKYEFEIVTAYGAGILTGYTDGSFKPMGTLTRAESATVIRRLTDEDSQVTPDLEALEKQNQEKKEEQAKQEAIINKEETVKENANRQIAFDPAADVNADGTMKEEKAIQYMDKVLDSLEFSGNNGNYFMTVTFPNLPDGFEWGYGADIQYTAVASKSGWGIGTGWSVVEDNIIKPVGTVKRQITGLKSISEIFDAVVGIDIHNKDGKYACSYFLQYVYSGTNAGRQILGVAHNDYMDIKYEYNLDKHFTWK